jgi:hypothetical protein
MFSPLRKIPDSWFLHKTAVLSLRVFRQKKKSQRTTETIQNKSSDSSSCWAWDGYAKPDFQHSSTWLKDPPVFCVRLQIGPFHRKEIYR